MFHSEKRILFLFLFEKKTNFSVTAITHLIPRATRAVFTGPFLQQKTMKADELEI